MTFADTACLQLHNRHTGEVLALRRRVRDGEVILELQGTLPPHRNGPPLHVHYLEDEEVCVTSGRLSVDVGGRRVEASPGEVVRLPRGVPHRWWNAADQPLALEGTAHPVADLDRYLQAICEVMNAGPPNRPPLFYLAHVALRHRRTQAALIMPQVLQAMLFRVVVAIGTITGRYRGTQWPGSPARCTGAPCVDDDSLGTRDPQWRIPTTANLTTTTS
jgi:mannose-6-phosphate isomerase-like protein (cupin superfamily)